MANISIDEILGAFVQPSKAVPLTPAQVRKKYPIVAKAYERYQLLLALHRDTAK